jgi:hypothetical protein
MDDSMMQDEVPEDMEDEVVNESATKSDEKED